MAILDNLARTIEKGDLLVLTSGECFAFEVVEVKEPSLIGADPRQVPMVQLVLQCQFMKSIPNPGRFPDVMISDALIVAKHEKTPAPPSADQVQ